MAEWKVEMRVGQDQRIVEADSLAERDGWFIFYRRPPTGGQTEYWRVWQTDVISIETRLR